MNIVIKCYCGPRKKANDPRLKTTDFDKGAMLMQLCS